jgi:hypothetical protein
LSHAAGRATILDSYSETWRAIMVRSVDDEPHVRLVKWGVLQDFHGYRLVGIHAGTRRGRVSSPVVAYDSHAKIAETESGRQYHLVGDPDPDVAATLIRIHAARWGVPVDEIAMAMPEELEEFLGPRPGERMN